MKGSVAAAKLRIEKLRRAGGQENLETAEIIEGLVAACERQHAEHQALCRDLASALTFFGRRREKV